MATSHLQLPARKGRHHHHRKQNHDQNDDVKNSEARVLSVPHGDDAGRYKTLPTEHQNLK